MQSYDFAVESLETGHRCSSVASVDSIILAESILTTVKLSCKRISFLCSAISDRYSLVITNFPTSLKWILDFSMNKSMLIPLMWKVCHSTEQTSNIDNKR